MVPAARAPRPAPELGPTPPRRRPCPGRRPHPELARTPPRRHPILAPSSPRTPPLRRPPSPTPAPPELSRTPPRRRPRPQHRPRPELVRTAPRPRPQHRVVVPDAGPAPSSPDVDAAGRKAADGLLARVESALSAAASAANALLRAFDPSGKKRRLCVLELVGDDHPGLLSEDTGALIHEAARIKRIESRLRPRAHAHRGALAAIMLPPLVAAPSAVNLHHAGSAMAAPPRAGAPATAPLLRRPPARRPPRLRHQPLLTRGPSAPVDVIMEDGGEREA
nr:uncharacterized protein LOC127347975 [Lolium perenne]